MNDLPPGFDATILAVLLALGAMRLVARAAARLRASTQSRRTRIR